MKFVALFLTIFVAFATAEIDNQVDWSNVSPIFQLIKQRLDERKNEPLQPPNRRIVNGQEAEPHQFPYQIALLIQSPTGTGLCGGSVISATAALTAAHCTSTGVTGYLLIAGAVNRVQIEPQQQRRQVPSSAFVPHPQYGPLRLVNDIAVIRVAEAFTLNNVVQAIALASNPNELHVDAVVTASGFGRYSDSHSRTSEVVLFTRKTVISNAQCSQSFPLLVVDSTICAVGTAGINNAVCNGDSGGPLTIIRNNESYQVGVVSFGSPQGCETGMPDGYARVSHFFTWISQTAGI
ncbi:hypothetical protein PVAND_003914 [Polypedilum vanderplanki]|uniref:Peptidase S1 domain-containing protein n=1 Tax=Polypedilum vanderplanki TaxID=319348 RepID=A0A9J6BVH0_POLVA|nr:hypothetical protein PVAND_003914 [Polypedilum vanderplanki]